MNRMQAILSFGLAVGVSAAFGRAAPQASLAPASWQLDFTFHDPQRLIVKLPGDTRETTLWYMLYEVTNNTGQDVQFYPSFQLVTDTLRVVDGGSDISPSVYDVIAARHKKEFPFLARPTQVTGLLLQGEGNARSSVAVFTDFDRDADRFTVYVSGLSGELASVPNPAFDRRREDSEENMRSFILRRTLAVLYDLPGDPQTRAHATPIRRTREWVMR